MNIATIGANLNKRGRKPGQKSQCSKCGEFGHYAKTCGKIKPIYSMNQEEIFEPKSKSSQRLCSKCHKPGHNAATCGVVREFIKKDIKNEPAAKKHKGLYKAHKPGYDEKLKMNFDIEGEWVSSNTNPWKEYCDSINFAGFSRNPLSRKDKTIIDKVLE